MENAFNIFRTFFDFWMNFDNNIMDFRMDRIMKVVSYSTHLYEFQVFFF